MSTNSTTPPDRNLPAFPSLETETTYGNEGMTLRDYFAAKAFQAIASPEDRKYDGYKVLSEESYEIADAMLKARAE